MLPRRRRQRAPWIEHAVAPSPPPATWEMSGRPRSRECPFHGRTNWTSPWTRGGFPRDTAVFWKTLLRRPHRARQAEGPPERDARTWRRVSLCALRSTLYALQAQARSKLYALYALRALSCALCAPRALCSTRSALHALYAPRTLLSTRSTRSTPHAPNPKAPRALRPTRSTLYALHGNREDLRSIRNRFEINLNVIRDRFMIDLRSIRDRLETDLKSIPE